MVNEKDNNVELKRDFESFLSSVVYEMMEKCTDAGQIFAYHEITYSNFIGLRARRRIMIGCPRKFKKKRDSRKFFLSFFY